MYDAVADVLINDINVHGTTKVYAKRSKYTKQIGSY
jgi:hypothetical protein